MHLINLFATLLLAGSTFAVPNGNLDERAICKKPFCKALCADGTPYDCCVVYIRDPCADHQKPCEGPDCVCQCPNGNGEYLCNVDYIRDPCEVLPTYAA